MLYSHVLTIYILFANQFVCALCENYVKM